VKPVLILTGEDAGEYKVGEAWKLEPKDASNGTESWQQNPQKS